ncbi:MAG TPA: hypothetical protein VNQ77_15235 [Frankiaceae bacterium]|nr:hypothetical protein [Frankiaceae bacterium]
MPRTVALALPLTLLALAAGGSAAPLDTYPLMAAGPRATSPADEIEQLTWLVSGTLPTGRYADLARTALLDVRRLTDRGAAVAAHAPYWRYVWPRDASFVAVAYARTGHLADARAVLDFLQEVQGEDGSFHARYLPDGSGPPDARGLQEDGPGWALWALAEVFDRDAASAGRYATLLDRSARRLESRAGLPPPSSDYWEVRERRLTLGIAAPTLAGLDAAAHVYAMTGHGARAEEVRHAADRTATAIERVYGPRYPRHLGGEEVDAAVTFLLPPFQRRTVAGAAEAAHHAPKRMRRTAGGVAPGEGWKQDGVSWTPETALFALVAATAGDDKRARHWLDWLARHRTDDGSLPEKVTYDGEPAGPAPLAWTSALVVLTTLALS